MWHQSDIPPQLLQRRSAPWLGRTDADSPDVSRADDVMIVSALGSQPYAVPLRRHIWPLRSEEAVELGAPWQPPNSPALYRLWPLNRPDRGRVRAIVPRRRGRSSGHEGWQGSRVARHSAYHRHDGRRPTARRRSRRAGSGTRAGKPPPATGLVLCNADRGSGSMRSGCTRRRDGPPRIRRSAEFGAWRSLQSGHGNSGRCLAGGCHLLCCRCLPGGTRLRRPVGRVHARRRDERCTRLLRTALCSSVVRALDRDGWRHPRESRRRSATTTPGSSRDRTCLGGDGLRSGRRGP